VLKRLSTAERIAIAIEQYFAAIRDAFISAINDIRSSTSLTTIAYFIEARDIATAIRALNIEGPAFNPMLDEIAKAFNGGGNSTIGDLPPINSADGFRIVLRFDARNLTAEAWLREHSSTMIREIVDDQINAIRAVMADGSARGLSSRALAADIIGRINPATGQRTGGILGLTSTQAEWVKAYRAELASLDGNALTRALRDRRYDKMLRKAIDGEKPLPAATVDNMVTSYENRALRYRAETIARTESLTAYQGGADEAMRQSIASGKIDARLVDAKWHTLMDGRERDSHGAMNGQIQPWGTSFVSGAGNRLAYPGDPSAPASERIGCRCSKTFVIRKEPRTLLQ
jgi:hypothetical protein